MPSTFCRKMGEEERTMKQFLAREVARVNYFKNRFKLREETFKKDTEEEEKQKEVKEEKHHKDDVIYLLWVYDEDKLLFSLFLWFLISKK